MKKQEKIKQAVKLLSKIAGYTDSVKEVERLMTNLTEVQFAALYKAAKEGTFTLPFIVPNFASGPRPTTEKNITLARELGKDVYQQLWITDAATNVTSLTPEKYPVFPLPVKLLQQDFESKFQIPKDNRHKDERTGQVTGKSKGSAMSGAELAMVSAQELPNVIGEIYHIRAGDDEANRLMEMSTGVGTLPTQTAIGDTRTKSAETFSILLKSAQLNNNF